MKILVASDNAQGRMFDAENDGKHVKPTAVANKYGHADTGEIVHIWMDDDTNRLPDYRVYWDSQYQTYRVY